MQQPVSSQIPIDLEAEERAYRQDRRRFGKPQADPERFAYLLQHVVAHLAKAGAYDQIYTTLASSRAWMELKRERYGSDAAYLADLNCAIEGAPEHLPPADRVRLIGLHTARQVVHLQASALTDMQARAMVWLDRGAEAIGSVSVRPTSDGRASGLIAIGAELRRRGQPIPALLLDQACASAAAVLERDRQGALLKAVALGYSDMGRPDRAAAALHRMHVNPTLDCLELVKDLAARGHPDTANRLLQHFVASASHPQWYSWLHAVPHREGNVAPMVGEESADQAFEQLYRRMMETHWSEALHTVAQALVRAGRSDEALALAQTMPDAQARAAAIEELAADAAAGGAADDPPVDKALPAEAIAQALAEIRAETSPYHRVLAYEPLLGGRNPAPAALIEALLAELTMVRSTTAGESQAHLLGYLAWYLAMGGHHEAAAVLEESRSAGIAGAAVPQPRVLTATLVGLDIQARLEALTQALQLAEAQNLRLGLNAAQLASWLHLGPGYLADTQDLQRGKATAAAHTPTRCGVALASLDLLVGLHAPELRQLLPAASQRARLLGDLAATLLALSGSAAPARITQALTLALDCERGHIIVRAILRNAGVSLQALPLLAGLAGWRAQRLLGATLAALRREADGSPEQAEALVATAAALAAAGSHAWADRLIARVTGDLAHAADALKAHGCALLARRGFFAPAFALPDTIQSAGYRSDALAALAACLTPTGDPRAGELFAQALALARGLPHSRQRALALGEIASAAMRAGDPLAERLFDEALAAAQMPDETVSTAAKESASQAHTQEIIVGMLVDCRQIDRALAVTEGIPPHEAFFRAQAQRHVVEGLARAGRFAEALQVAEAIGYDLTRERTETRLQLARIAAEDGRVAAALTALSSCALEDYLGTLPALMPALARHGQGAVGGAVQEVARITGWLLGEWYQAAAATARWREAPADRS